MINLFYEEPDPDRFVRFDRHPRRVLRRLVRGRPRPGGQQRVFLNLCAGLDRLGVPYRVNDYAHARRHPTEPVCIIGKPHVLDKVAWRNPIYFGAAVFNHPIDDPHLFERLPVRRMLVPGEWMRRMCEPYYGDKVQAWPAGIDTDRWAASPADRDVDVLVYDKILWRRPECDASLLRPIAAMLAARGLRSVVIRYGFYEEDDYRRLLARAKAMIFLCEHETQGIAYQQALACDVPLFAWDRGGYWQDPEYYPHRVAYGPVSSVPYWDERCGLRFADLDEFTRQLDEFLERTAARAFAPRAYILDNLTLDRCARRYLDLVDASRAPLGPAR